MNATTGNPTDHEESEGPQVEDLPVDESPRDLQHHEISGEFPGGWKFALRSGSKAFGRALAWLIVVAVSIGSGYAVDRLVASLAMGSSSTLVLVLITSATVLVGGACYVEANIPWKSLKLSSAIALLALACLAIGAFYVVDRHSNLFNDRGESLKHRGVPGITGDSYTVRPGDTLWDIADRWGDEGGYQDLVAKNPGTQPSGTDIRRNPNLIHPGDVFKNPETPTSRG